MTTSEPTHFNVSQNSDIVIQGYQDGSFILSNLNARGVLYRHCVRLPHACSWSTFSSNGHHLLALSRDPKESHACVWRVDLGLPIGPVLCFGHTAHFRVMSSPKIVQVLVLEPGGHFSPSKLHLLEATTGKRTASVTLHTRANLQQCSMVYSLEQKIVAVVTLDEIDLFRLPALDAFNSLRSNTIGPRNPVFSRHVFEVTAASFVGPVVCVVAFAKGPGQVTRFICSWHFAAPEMPIRLTALQDVEPFIGIASGVFSSDGARLSIAASDDLRVYDTSDGSCSLHFKRPGCVLRLAGDSAKFVMIMGPVPGHISLWHLHSDSPVFTLDRQGTLVGTFNQRLLEECYGSGISGDES